MAWADRITEEINTILDRLARDGDTWVARWVAQEVCAAHDSALLDDREDAGFWHHVGYLHVREQVRRTINRRADPEQSEGGREQMLMPGFDHLQQYYVVEREGDRIGVPTPDLTDDELMKKASEYRRKAEAMIEHANEIERYVQRRQNGHGVAHA